MSKQKEMFKAADGDVITVDGFPMVLSAAESEDVRVLRDVAKSIIQKTGEIGVLYRTLVEYIRTKNVSHKIAGTVLFDMGFNKVRVSEIIRVAMAPDDVYTAFAAQAIGFKATLQIVRETDKGVEITPAMKQLAAESKEWSPSEAAVYASQEVTSALSPVRTDKQKIEAHVSALVRLVQRSKVWRVDGWVLTLKREPKAKAAGKAAALHDGGGEPD